MEFCPNCGKLLTPSSGKEEVVLACKVCGYAKPIDRAQRKYVWTERVNSAKRRKAVVVVTSPALEKHKKEERELAQEYYEVFLEAFTEAGEAGED
ncbi:MAG: DNA-directed RNA polymerase subunit M [Candidatus Nezhaarchaeota archaeon]|nr:DNA-directed RNA polymerase subunit M [Candidatus Nezhaarchaeota archaeon]